MGNRSILKKSISGPFNIFTVAVTAALDADILIIYAAHWPKRIQRGAAFRNSEGGAGGLGGEFTARKRFEIQNHT